MHHGKPKAHRDYLTLMHHAKPKAKWDYLTLMHHVKPKFIILNICHLVVKRDYLALVHHVIPESLIFNPNPVPLCNSVWYMAIHLKKLKVESKVQKVYW